MTWLLFIYYALGCITTMDTARRQGTCDKDFTPENFAIAVLAGLFWPLVWVTYYPFLTGRARAARLAAEAALEMDGRSEVNRFLGERR